MLTTNVYSQKQNSEENMKLLKSRIENSEMDGNAFVFRFLNDKIESLIKSIDSCTENGEFLVFDNSSRREFWKRHVIGASNKMIFATNTFSGGTSFGRSDERDLIEAQRDAVERNVDISRVFLIDQWNNEIDELRTVCSAQEKAGVKTYIASKNKIVDIHAKHSGIIPHYDFVIIDYKNVYCTITKETKDAEKAGVVEIRGIMKDIGDEFKEQIESLIEEIKSTSMQFQVNHRCGVIPDA